MWSGPPLGLDLGIDQGALDYAAKLVIHTDVVPGRNGWVACNITPAMALETKVVDDRAITAVNTTPAGSAPGPGFVR